jgi:hypothetical protein
VIPTCARNRASGRGPTRFPEETGLKCESVTAFVKRNTGALLAVLSLGAIVVGCGNGRVVHPITIDPRPLGSSSEARFFTTYEAALRGISRIFVRDLGLPVPERLAIYVYPSRATFESGLIRDAQLTPERAGELSEFAIGVSKRRQLLFNDEAYGQRGREWLRLVTHELAHVSQFELADGEGRGEQWLAEGMAEWTAFTVLERLGYDTMARRRNIARAGLQSHAAILAARLDLEVLGTPRGFTVRHLRDGSRPTYQLAFLMSDYLITRDGLPRVIDYFRSFASGSSRRKSFGLAFGQPLDEFEGGVRGYLNSLVR